MGTLIWSVLWFLSLPLAAGGGPLGIDSRLAKDDHGIWGRSSQTRLTEVVLVTEVVGALVGGGQTRIGRTFWQAMDATALSAITVETARPLFSRSRPRLTESPNQWFQGHGHGSFPSGEVALQASFVTPFILEYHHDHPWVWALAALPAYDAIARVKVRGHWQTDVLAGAAIGCAWGMYAHRRSSPFILGVLPDGFTAGLRITF